MFPPTAVSMVEIERPSKAPCGHDGLFLSRSREDPAGQAFGCQTHGQVSVSVTAQAPTTRLHSQPSRAWGVSTAALYEALEVLSGIFDVYQVCRSGVVLEPRLGEALRTTVRILYM